MSVKLGIIGVESKHAEFFGGLINRQQLLKGYAVEAIAPVDDPQRLKYVLSCTDIPHVVRHDELIEMCDAVLVVTRRGETHFNYAEQCLRAGKPVFVDKPFTRLPDEATEIVRLSLELGVPMLGGSTLCYMPETRRIRNEARGCASALLRYKADPDSKFGGYSFYASHLCDLCTYLFEGEPRSVFCARSADCVTSTVCYGNKNIVLETTLEHDVPEILFSKDGKITHHRLNDSDCYRWGLEEFARLIESGKPSEDTGRLVLSVKLLAAINESLASGRAISL